MFAFSFWLQPTVSHLLINHSRMVHTSSVESETFLLQISRNHPPNLKPSFFVHLSSFPPQIIMFGTLPLSLRQNQLASGRQNPCLHDELKWSRGTFLSWHGGGGQSPEIGLLTGNLSLFDPVRLHFSDELLNGLKNACISSLWSVPRFFNSIRLKQGFS